MGAFELVKEIYIVTKGVYSDYRICGVFSKREDADLFAKVFCGVVEVYPLDSFPLEKLREGWKAYRVEMDKYGDVIYWCEDEDGYDALKADWRECTRFDTQGHMITTVIARDPQHAAKIANERRTQLLAMG